MKKILYALFFLFIAHALLLGLRTVPSEGDSLAYHIPIAQRVWAGGLLHPSDILHFYPSIGEVLLSVFMFFGIPLNLFNVVGAVVLFFSCIQLANKAGLKNNVVVLFAVSIGLLPITMRWIHTQVIDIWLAVFFVWSLASLLKPLKTTKVYLASGVVLGLLMGTKTSGLGFAVILMLLYSKNIWMHITAKRLISFLIPMGVLGIFWYVRNMLLVGNPLYPQSVFGLPGAPGWNILQWNVGIVAIQYPGRFVNAIVSEYIGWSVLLLIPLFFFRNEMRKSSLLRTITSLGNLNLCFFLFLPTTPNYDIIVSSLRYAYPVFIPLLLVVFLLLQKRRKESLLYATFAINIAILLIHPYHPKLAILCLLPVLLYLQYAVNHKKSRGLDQ